MLSPDDRLSAFPTWLAILIVVTLVASLLGALIALANRRYELAPTPERIASLAGADEDRLRSDHPTGGGCWSRPRIAPGARRARLGPVASELLDAGSRFTKEQLGGIREFLRLGAEISYRRAEEISAEVASRGLIRPRRQEG